MARGRMICKTLSTSQRRASLHAVAPELSEFCQQLYPLLLAHADDWGRQQGDVFTIKHAIDPTSPRPMEDFERGLQALEEVDLIRWYLIDGRRFIQIQDFDKYQTGLHKRTSSSFPPAPLRDAEVGTSGKSPELPDQLNLTELNRREGKAAAPPPVRPVRPLRSPTIFQPRNGNAAFEGLRGLYVPQLLHNQFVGLRNHVAAEQELLAWYERVTQAWAHGAMKDQNPDADMFKFWKARYADEWPPAKGTGTTGQTPEQVTIERNKAKYGSAR